jgi:hypothetical protein
VGIDITGLTVHVLDEQGQEMSWAEVQALFKNDEENGIECDWATGSSSSSGKRKRKRLSLLQELPDIKVLYTCNLAIYY